jgi:hypothetical protein
VLKIVCWRCLCSVRTLNDSMFSSIADLIALMQPGTSTDSDANA